MKIRRKRFGARPSVAPLPSRELVDPTFRRLKLEELARSFRALRAFWEAAGPRIRTHARGERLRGTILYVRVASSAWFHELHALRPQLLVKLQRTAGGEGVEEMRFNVGPLDETPAWDSAPPPPPDEPEPPRAAIADEIVRAMGDVADDDLREQLTRLYARLGVRRL